MKEKPMIFSVPMVRAILEGRKSQTRRIINPDTWNPASSEFSGRFRLGAYSDKIGLQAYFEHLDTGNWFGTKCPYGQPGDRLWVKENFSWYGCEYDQSEVAYKADTDYPPPCFPKWKSSRYMPRWASRITLEITGIRVERLQDISGQDAIAEGIDRIGGNTSCCPWRNYRISEASEMPLHCSTPTRSYMTLWELLNGPGSWDKNPWVWVIEFSRVDND